jgi:arylsulfatase A-like enzyme
MLHRIFLACTAILCAACGDEHPPIQGPPSARIEIQPDYGLFRQRDPERDVPFWARMNTILLRDRRDAHRLTLDGELLVPVPKGASAIETSIAAVGSRESVEGRELKLEIDLVEGASRRRVHETRVLLPAAREGWQAVSCPLGPALRHPAGLSIRARLVGPASNAPVPELHLAAPGFPVPAAKRPNVLILSIDTLRADHMGCYGYARATTPRIDAFARGGVLFEHAQSSAPWTLPSYGSLFTSRSPTVHRAGVNPARAATFRAEGDATAATAIDNLAAALPTLAEILRDSGWATAGFHSNPYLTGEAGVDRGFSRWVHYKNRAAGAVDLALEWTQLQQRAPWFAFVHVVDPHQPYTPPAPYDARFKDWPADEKPEWPVQVEPVRASLPDATFREYMVDQYDGEIAYTDAEIGRLLDELARRGELENTIVLLHSDHGEGFWDHGGYEHGHTLYEEGLRVPLVLSAKGRLPAGVRVTTRVGLIDVLPTLLDLAGLPAASGVEGLSLVPLCHGQPIGARDLFAESLLYGAREAKALYVGNEKLIQIGGRLPMLFDLATDPGELHDLAARNPGRAEELRARLMKRVDALEAQALTSETRTFDEHDRSDLHNLGYTGAGGDDDGRRKKD